MATKNALTKAQETGIAERPSFVPQSKAGTEHITREDVQIPRILLAQKMSPEVDDSDAKYIEGLKIGDFFNGLTHTIYGRGPLKFVILRADPPRFVEFIPRSEGGGVRDPNVPAGDPRTQFGPNGEKPLATKFYDYIIMLLPFEGDPLANLVALSFKSTGIKVAKQLNALIQLRNAEVFAGVYSLTSVDTQNSLGKFSIPSVANAGWLDSQELYDQMKTLSETVRGREMVIDRSGDQDDDLEFPPKDQGNVSGM